MTLSPSIFLKKRPEKLLAAILPADMRQLSLKLLHVLKSIRVWKKTDLHGTQ